LIQGAYLGLLNQKRAVISNLDVKGLAGGQMLFDI